MVKVKKEIPPKSHNLIYLSEKAKIVFKSENEMFLGILMKYQLEGRYPDYNPNIPSEEKALKYLKKTKEIFLWLKSKL